MMCKCEYKHLRYPENRETWINGYATEFDDEDDLPMLEFRGYIEPRYILSYFIDKNTVEVINEKDIKNKYNKKEFDHYWNLLKIAKEEKKNIVINNRRILSVTDF